MSDYSDTVDLLSQLGIEFEEKEFRERQSLFIESDGDDILGYPGSHVELKFHLDGSFDRPGIYPKQPPKQMVAKDMDEGFSDTDPF